MGVAAAAPANTDQANKPTLASCDAKSLGASGGAVRKMRAAASGEAYRCRISGSDRSTYVGRGGGGGGRGGGAGRKTGGAGRGPGLKVLGSLAGFRVSRFLGVQH